MARAAERRSTMSAVDAAGTTTSCPCSSRTAPASSPGWRRCSPGGATTSSRWPSRRPRTSGSAASRSWSTSSSAPLEQITKQLFKLIEVVKISELDPRQLRRARAAARHGPGRPPRRAARWWSWCTIFEGKILAVGRTRSPSRWTVTPSKLDDFEELAPRLWHRGAAAHRPDRAAEARSGRRAHARRERERPADGRQPCTTRPTPIGRSSKAARWPSSATAPRATPTR